MNFVRPSLALALFLLALSVVPNVQAQLPVRVDTPGRAFVPEGVVAPGMVEDVPGGRRFRAKPGALLRLRATLNVPPARSAEPKMRRLVIRFRTSNAGPSLRAVELRNGSSVEFRINTDLKGDYTARETTTPDFVANTWDLKSAPRNVSSQSLIRLEVQFPQGFDSRIDPGEFVISAVTVDFPAKPGDFSTPHIPAGPIISGASASAKGVLYALNDAKDLLWYRHDGYSDGSFRWSDSRKVGNSWNFKQVFSGGDGVIYAVTPTGDLLWYRHDGHADGSSRWQEPRKVGSGWNFKELFSGGRGVIYAVNEAGDLLWYRHDGYADGSFRWSGPKTIGNSWNFKQIFSGGDGVIYAVTDSDDLLWYRHDGYADGSYRWAESKKVGSGWTFKKIFSVGGGVIYGISSDGDLMWYRHDGYKDGAFRWTEAKKVGSGWNFENVMPD